MKERMVSYLEYIDKLLNEDNSDTDYEELIATHLIQIEFFMHERLIHLIVTVLFALGTFMTIFTYLFLNNIGLLLLALLLIVLLIPYIAHYYLLENGVQKMYKQYDIMLERNRKVTD